MLFPIWSQLLIETSGTYVLGTWTILTDLTLGKPCWFCEWSVAWLSFVGCRSRNLIFLDSTVTDHWTWSYYSVFIKSAMTELVSLCTELSDSWHWNWLIFIGINFNSMNLRIITKTDCKTNKSIRNKRYGHFHKNHMKHIWSGILI